MDSFSGGNCFFFNFVFFLVWFFFPSGTCQSNFEANSCIVNG